MGRKPTPTALKILAGNPGKRRLNKKEPQMPEGVPECPEHLDGEARKEWDRLAPMLSDSGVLTQADRGTLATYCQIWARWVDAETKAKEQGLLVQTPQGAAIQNPYVGIANTAAKLLRGYAAELGLTPSARTKISATGDTAAATEALNPQAFDGKLRLAK
jgi:P27 family predicted phage terminase small subunit